MLKPKSIFSELLWMTSVWPKALKYVFNYTQFNEMEVNCVNDVSISPIVCLEKTITRAYLCICVDKRGCHGKEGQYLMTPERG